MAYKRSYKKSFSAKKYGSRKTAYSSKRRMGSGKRRTFSKYRKYGRKSTKSLSRTKNQVTLGMGFPTTMKVGHRYVDQALTVARSDVMQFVVWTCNGMTHPDLGAGVGTDPTPFGSDPHTPTNFQHMIDIYNHYTVIGSKLKIYVSFTQLTSSESEEPALVFPDPEYSVEFVLFRASNQTPVPFNINALREQNGAKVVTMSGRYGKNIMLTDTFSLKKTWGTKAIVGDDLMRGDANDNPDDQTYWHLGYRMTRADDGSIVLTSGISIRFEVDYIALWQEAVVTDQSPAVPYTASKPDDEEEMFEEEFEKLAVRPESRMNVQESVAQLPPKKVLRRTPQRLSN